jgi:murein DD-endopeptidase MepM/ murein hydrolase activator NlpD
MSTSSRLAALAAVLLTVLVLILHLPAPHADATPLPGPGETSTASRIARQIANGRPVHVPADAWSPRPDTTSTDRADATEDGASTASQEQAKQAEEAKQAKQAKKAKQAKQARKARKARKAKQAKKTDRTPAELAAVGDTRLLVPSRHAVGGGFHQANQPASRQMDPLPASRVTTLPSRGRGTGGRTALDLAVEADTTVLAAATGTVVEARTYRLYGQLDDQLVVIRTPEGRDVRMLHLDGLEVQVGDHVEAGRSPVASRAHLLPFGSQIDRLLGRHPHVHLEVR